MSDSTPTHSCDYSNEAKSDIMPDSVSLLEPMKGMHPNLNLLLVIESCSLRAAINSVVSI